MNYSLRATPIRNKESMILLKTHLILSQSMDSTVISGLKSIFNEIKSKVLNSREMSCERKSKDLDKKIWKTLYFKEIH